jgi:general stress protein YciG
MSGTSAGARKAAATNRARHGKDFYARIGSKGGKKGHTGGFYANRDLARRAGAKGGRISRRGPAKKAATTVVVADQSSAAASVAVND